ncbi:MAG: DUF5672 family protein [Steroidobacteraceae bacterium]
MLNLPDVTICAVDCAQPILAARALTLSMSGCRFGDALLLSDRSIEGAFRNVRIPAVNSRQDYSGFILKQLASYVSTPAALIIQWDGYVLDPCRWLPDFMQYDYVGAEWPWHGDRMTVGNGGFSLRSRRLLALTAGSDFPAAGEIAEDVWICRLHRATLEQHHGVRFAPVELARCFSYERGIPEAPTFGFHGMFNLWRHVPDEDLIGLLGQLGPSVPGSREYLELMLHYLAERRFRPALALFSTLQQTMPLEQIRLRARQYGPDPSIIDAWIARCALWTDQAMMKPHAQADTVKDM